MAPSHPGRSAPGPAGATPVTPATPARDEPSVSFKGPHPGNVSVSKQFAFEQRLRRRQRDNGCDPAREDSYRLQGVQLIGNVRESLQLPAKTFDTACTYYHKFRLCFRDAEYNYQDAALASLFVACKVEDTIKKSREILCAAYNIKNPDHTTTQDDRMFEQPSKIIIGLERLILETIGFDFRVRYPQKLLVKVVRQLLGSEDSRDFYQAAYDMCIDMYKTFAPIKQSTFGMVMAIVELTARITETHLDAAGSLPLHKWHTSRAGTVETMLDLLDLYTQFPKSTRLGRKFDRDQFIGVKISINQEVENSKRLLRFERWCERCAAEDKDCNPITPGSATSPATTGSWPGGSSVKRSSRGQDGTMRFVFDAEQARKEQDVVAQFHRDEFEECEVEVEEEIPEEARHGQGQHGHPAHGHGHSHGHGHNHGQGPGHGGGRERHYSNHNSNHDSGWAPYPRNRHGHQERHRGGRKGPPY